MVPADAETQSNERCWFPERSADRLWLPVADPVPFDSLRGAAN
jgi:hypothetical protein